MRPLYDARLNEITGTILDQIGGGTVTDSRPAGDTLNAVDEEVAMDLDGKASAMFEIRSAANSATYVFEGTIDGDNYHQFVVRGLIGNNSGDDQNRLSLFSVVVTSSIAAVYIINCVGFKRVRCRVSSYTSGSATVTGRATSRLSSAMIRPQAAPLHVTSTAAVNTITAVTLPVATGMFHYVTNITLSKLYNSTGTASGAGVTITSSNFSPTLTWTTEQRAAAAGTVVEVIKHFYDFPLKSDVPGNTSQFSAPAQGQTIWRWNVSYYVGY